MIKNVISFLLLYTFIILIGKGTTMKLKMIQVNEDTHHELKTKALQKKMSLKEYIAYLLTLDK